MLWTRKEEFWDPGSKMSRLAPDPSREYSATQVSAQLSKLQDSRLWKSPPEPTPSQPAGGEAYMIPTESRCTKEVSQWGTTRESLLYWDIVSSYCVVVSPILKVGWNSLDLLFQSQKTLVSKNRVVHWFHSSKLQKPRLWKYLQNSHLSPMSSVVKLLWFQIEFIRKAVSQWETKLSNKVWSLFLGTCLRRVREPNLVSEPIFGTWVKLRLDLLFRFPINLRK